jgi:hypothetical protein
MSTPPSSLTGGLGTLRHSTLPLFPVQIAVRALLVLCPSVEDVNFRLKTFPQVEIMRADFEPR